VTANLRPAKQPVSAPSPERNGSRPGRVLGWQSATTGDVAALVGVLVAILPALWPLAQPGLAATHDGFLHVQRIIAIEAAARQGGPFLRWLPDLAFGYGQPLLLYYAPLAYLPALLARLLGAGYVASFEFASGLALLLSALAMYACGRALLGPLAAGVAAVVYATLPYQLVDLYVRGALAESWAFVWLPLTTLCLLRAWTESACRPRWCVGLALTLAALILTHNVTALLFLPALLVLAALLQVQDGTGWRATPPRPLLAIGAGLLLSAWFWLPALAERGLVQIGETLEPALFASFFVRSWPPFRLDTFYDYQQPVSIPLGSPIFWPQLGLVQAVTTLVGAGATLRATALRRTFALWALALAGGSYLMQLGPLAPLYDAVPLLAFVQFPWRLLALLGLGSALLAGLLVERLAWTRPLQAAAATLIVVASVVTATARLDPEPVPVSDHLLSVESIARAELADYGLGTTHSGEYLPVASGQRNAARLRKTILDAGGGAARQAAAPPMAVHVHSVRWRADRISFDVDAPTADRLVVQQFAFPGWVARIEGDVWPVAASGPLGLLTIDVPMGMHHVELAWEWTPLRMVASSVSVLSIMLLVLLGSATPRRLEPRRILLGCATMGLVVSLVSPADRTPLSAQDGAGQSPTLATGRGDVVGLPLSLLDVQRDTSRLSRDGVAGLRLIWLVRQASAAGYRASVEVAAADGTVHRAPWIYEPLSRLWERGEILQTAVSVRLPAAFPAGPADLRLVFDRPAELEPVALGTLDVPATVTQSAVAATANEITVGTGLALGSSGEVPAQSAVRAGGALDVGLRWRAVAPMPDVERELLVVAALAAPGGDVLSEVRRPGDWFAPLPFWQAGDVIEQRIRLAVPASVPPGSYPLRVRVYGRNLARGGISEPGASEARLRGQPLAELPLGTVQVTP